MSVSSARARLALAALLSASTLTLTACGGGSGEAASGSEGGGERETVAVATTTQLGSVLEQIAQCNGAQGLAVMGPGDDPHDFSASSQQVAEMARSGLVFTNGLGLEGGMGSALRNAEADGAQVVEVAPEVDPIPFGAGSGHEGHDHGDEDGHEGHNHGSEDPHFWLDVARMAQAATFMGETLQEKTGDEKYGECGQQVHDELMKTDEQVRGILESIPEDRRTLMTDHDAYGYFAEAYDFEVSGVVVPGGSTDGKPSSQALAELTKTLQDNGADALLTSAGTPMAEVESLSRDGGDIPVIELYEGGIGPKDSEASTYADAMVYNAEQLAAELGA
ncbi:metal ABC transporter substrate-binding protein [Micrococcus luteus]